jgi:hypothetical protein
MPKFHLEEYIKADEQGLEDSLSLKGEKEAAVTHNRSKEPAKYKRKTRKPDEISSPACEQRVLLVGQRLLIVDYPLPMQDARKRPASGSALCASSNEEQTTLRFRRRVHRSVNSSVKESSVKEESSVKKESSVKAEDGSHDAPSTSLLSRLVRRHGRNAVAGLRKQYEESPVPVPP